MRVARGVVSDLLARWSGRLRRWRGDVDGGDGSDKAVEVGRRSEHHAARWLRSEKAYRILARNWRHKRDELDIVALDGPVLVFVEVRARRAGALVPGYHSVTRRKKEALRRCAIAYLGGCRPRPAHFRFDIVEIELNNGEVLHLRHFENVPLFRKHDQTTRS